MVRTAVFTTLMQVASRVFVVAICDNIVEAQSSIGIPIFTIAWSITEVARYSWYGIGQVAKPAPAHTHSAMQTPKPRTSTISRQPSAQLGSTSNPSSR